MERRISKVIG